MKTCTTCGDSFTPASGRQVRCDDHRAIPKPTKTVVPASVRVSDGPERAERQRRVDLALKLGRTALRGGYSDIARDYCQYVEILAAGDYQPHPAGLQVLLGHGFGPALPGIRTVTARDCLFSQVS